MKRSTKIALVVALCCILLGTLLGFYSVQTQDFNWNVLSLQGSDPVVVTHPITEEFHDIRIEDIRCGIRILPATGQECTVICADCDAYAHRVEVRRGTLCITAEDHDWFFTDLPATELVVYLPNTELGSLELETVSGDVEIHEALTFREAELSGVSGNLQIRCAIQEELHAGSVSGDIRLENMDIRGELELETISGNILLDLVDAPSARLQSVSGDITCSIPTEKHLVTHTVSGNVRAADDPVSSDIWELTTTSGNITVTIPD